MTHKPSVILTGSSGGIGAHVTAKLIDAGWHVIGLDLESPDVALPADFDFIAYDLADLATGEEAGKALLAELQKRPAFVAAKGLVNNAATQIIAPAHELPVSDFTRTLDVNLVAAFQMSRLCFDVLSKNAGSIVNVSSIHARLSKKTFAAYAVSKAALSALTRSLALEWGDRVRVNGIEPAAIETDMLRAGFGDEWQEKRAALAGLHPSGDIGQADDVFQIVALLLQGETRFLNGSIIQLDGGIAGVLHDPD